MVGGRTALQETARYGGLAIGLSWAFGLPAVVADRSDRLPQVLVGLGLAGFMAGPTAAACILSRDPSEAGWRSLLDRFRRRSFPSTWWLAVPVAGALAAATTTAPLRDAGLPSPGMGAVAGALAAAPFVVAAASLEETGWRGYLLPRLQRDVSPAAASALIGVPWGIWHLPLLLLPTGANSQVPPWFYIAGPLVGSFLYTGLFNATSGSLLVVTAVHGIRNVVSGIFLQGHEENFDPTLAYAADLAAVLAAAVVVFAAMGVRRRGREHAPCRTPPIA